MDTPVSLLERLRRPADAEAWSRFVHLYTPLLYYWARRAGLQEADAADLVQEVLALLFQKLPEFHYQVGQSFRAWLRTVTLNKWRERERRARVPTVDDAAVSELPAPDLQSAFEENEYRAHLVRQALHALRNEFPAVSWKAFHGYVIEDRPASEVAAELNVALGTIYAAKSRILTRLRQELAGLLD